MLFILYGATLEMGYQCREMFRDFGFDIIKKYNYIDDDSKLDKSLYENPEQDTVFSRWYNDKRYVTSLEEIEKCDFHYALDGVNLGFNKDQILNAVHGSGDALLTIGASSLSFVIQLKKAYGDYVTLINLFSDPATVRSDNRISARITEQELSVRNDANKRMQQAFLEHMTDFDETVIYTGAEKPYDMDALRLQFETIIRRRRLIEKALNDRRYVELPYKGSDPYLFISYSHKDTDKVYSELTELQRNAYRVWYDDGIRGGENWRRIIADKIKCCSQFLIFVSENAVSSSDVEAELNGALDLGKKMVIANLDGAQFGFEYRMYLKNINQLDYRSSDFRKKLSEALDPKLKES